MKAPEELLKIQQWFGELISHPLNDKQKLDFSTSCRDNVVRRAAEYILPSPTLKPRERIEIYNQQYWWRLLGVLRGNFPSLVACLGEKEFDRKVGVPYLLAHPSTNWSIDRLGDALPEWLKGDDERINTLAHIDRAYLQSLFGERSPIRNDAATSQGLQLQLRLQGHLQLLVVSHRVLEWRRSVVDAKGKGTPPLSSLKALDEAMGCAIYRDAEGRRMGLYIPKLQMEWLSLFRRPCSLLDSIDWIEFLDPSKSVLAGHSLNEWIRQAIQLCWLKA